MNGDLEHDNSTNAGNQQLRSLIERIERLNEEKKAIGDDIREFFAKAKADGFDTKVLRQVIRLRQMDRQERLEQEAILHTYLVALGMEAVG